MDTFWTPPDVYHKITLSERRWDRRRKGLQKEHRLAQKFIEKEVNNMTKKDILDVLAEDYSASDVRDVARTLRDDYEYDSIKISHAKEELCDELEGIVWVFNIS